ASLSLDEVKPCELIPQPKREALKVSNGPILSETVGGVGLEGTTCKYYVKYEKPTENPVSKTTTTSVKLGVVTNHGVEWRIDRTNDSEHFEYKDVSRVQDYRAIRV